MLNPTQIKKKSLNYPKNVILGHGKWEEGIYHMPESFSAPSSSSPSLQEDACAMEAAEETCVFIALAQSLHQFSPNPLPNASRVPIASKDMAAKQSKGLENHH